MFLHSSVCPERPAEGSKRLHTFVFYNMSPREPATIQESTMNAKVPNGPSKTGNPSGKGRGNLPPKKKSYQLIIFALFFCLLLPINAKAQLSDNLEQCKILSLSADGYYMNWGAPRKIELFWSIYENDPVSCKLYMSDDISYFELLSFNGFREELLKVADKFEEWIKVARNNGIKDTWQKIPVEITQEPYIYDKSQKREFESTPSTGAFFMVNEGKMFCQIVFRADKLHLTEGTMDKEFFNYGLQFASPQEVRILADCLDLETMNVLKWGRDPFETIQLLNKRNNSQLFR